jgi:5-methylcytosine-specific restriction endonuclease McrA
MDLDKAIYWHNKRYKDRCFYCGVRFSEEHKRTIDHVRPRYLAPRGNDVNSNRVPACEPCNQLKSHHSLETFRILMGRVKFFFETGIEL